MTGCAAQIEPETFLAMPEVSKVFGNTEKLKKNFWSSCAMRKYNSYWVRLSFFPTEVSVPYGFLFVSSINPVLLSTTVGTSSHL